MVVREVIAERVAGLKKHIPVETPVIDTVSLPAKIVSSVAIPLGKVDGIIPIIARGKAYGEVAGRWYRVNFARALPDVEVAAVAEGRAGEFPIPTAPTIAISTVNVPKAIPVNVPVFSIQRPPMFYKRYYDCAKSIAPVCEGLNDFHKHYEDFQNTVGLAIEAINDGFAKVKKMVEDTNVSLSDFRNKVNTALDEQRSNIEAAVNGGLADVLPLLYSAWGIPKNMAVTPLHVRNVTSTGFDFQSYGKTTCRYIAVGSLR